MDDRNLMTIRFPDSELHILNAMRSEAEHSNKPLSRLARELLELALNARSGSDSEAPSPNSASPTSAELQRLDRQVTQLEERVTQLLSLLPSVSSDEDCR